VNGGFGPASISGASAGSRYQTNTENWRSLGRVPLALPGVVSLAMQVAVRIGLPARAGVTGFHYGWLSAIVVLAVGRAVLWVAESL
jgi:hypothetical protein